ncbi:MAG: AbrB/MazE/SpoVT family DNA-binding domain-containing protein [Candidatus Saccharimonadales bacterium]
MNTISTNLTTSGNSVAVRLPKELLRMSGLSNRVTLEAKQGKIIISNPVNVREGWEQQIEAEITTNGLPTAIDKYGDMQAEVDATLLDGME